MRGVSGDAIMDAPLRDAPIKVAIRDATIRDAMRVGGITVSARRLATSYHALQSSPNNLFVKTLGSA